MPLHKLAYASGGIKPRVERKRNPGFKVKEANELAYASDGARILIASSLREFH